MRFSKSILFTAAALLVPFVSNAGPISPSPTLSAGGVSLSIGDLSFDNFTCALSGGGGHTPSSCDSINVRTITQPGDGIQISSGFSTYGKNSFSDAEINYNVSSHSGIDSVGLDFNGTFWGKAIASVTETVFHDGVQVGEAYVACGSGQAGCTMTDNIALSGTFTDLYIQKDIQLDSYAGKAGANLSYVDQTFALAPEPSTLAMLGGGLLAAGLLRRRAKAAVKA